MGACNGAFSGRVGRGRVLRVHERLGTRVFSRLIVWCDNNNNNKKESTKNTKKKESEFAKSYCQEKYKENKNQVNCIKFFSPYGESLRKVKEPFWLSYCLPKKSENFVITKDLSTPDRESILSLNKCLRSNAKVKTPPSLLDTINISLADAMSQSIYDTFIHKGKTYTASRACGEGRSMQWMTYPSFLGIGGRVEELGCMNRLEHERYMRNYRAGIDSRPVIINNPAPITQPSSRPMLIPMYQKPINCTGVNYGGAGFSATCN